MQENIWLQLPLVFPEHSPLILISTGFSGGVRERLKCSHPLHILMKRWNHSTCFHICRALPLDENITLLLSLGKEGTVYSEFGAQWHFSSALAPGRHLRSPVLRPHHVSISLCLAWQVHQRLLIMRPKPHTSVSKWHLNSLKGGWTWHAHPCTQPVLLTLPKVRDCDGKYLRWINTYEYKHKYLHLFLPYFPWVCSLLWCCDAAGYNNPQVPRFARGVKSFCYHALSPHQRCPCRIQKRRTPVLALKWGLCLLLTALLVLGARSALALHFLLPSERKFLQVEWQQQRPPEMACAALVCEAAKITANVRCWCLCVQWRRKEKWGLSD